MEEAGGHIEQNIRDLERGEGQGWLAEEKQGSSKKGGGGGATWSSQYSACDRTGGYKEGYVKGGKG